MIYKSRGYSVLCLCLKLSWLLLVFVSGCTSLIVVRFQLFFFSQLICVSVLFMCRFVTQFVFPECCLLKLGC